MERKVTLDEWVGRFRAAGLDDGAMKQWHMLFERENPAGHQDFLEWLGVGDDRISEIRGNSA